MPLIKKKTQMPKRGASDRAADFGEVACGYSTEQALEEASRCLFCKDKPCIAGCPVGVDIPAFIKLITEKKFFEAYLKIKETNCLSAVCGRVCPQEDQCELLCTMGKKFEPVGIGRLERFVSDFAYKENPSGTPLHPDGKTNPNKSNILTGTGKSPFNPPFPKRENTGTKTCKKVAIIGSGPGGLTAAGELAGAGFAVTVFEALHEAGGVLTYGIPEFRLPKEIVRKEIENLKKTGVNFKYGCVIGKTKTLNQLFSEGYSAVYIGIGAGLPKFMGLPGENLNGVYSANEFLTRINLMKAYKFPEYITPVKKMKNVGVVGGGNVAMDSARCALRLKAENVYNIYRRSREEMPARKEEIANAEEEGIKFNFLLNPVEIIGDEKGFVRAMKCAKMKLGEPDESGRRRPVVIPGEFLTFEVDTVVIAVGAGANPLLPSTVSGLKLNKWGYIEINPETMETSIKNVFAGGDIVTGSATVISAMGAGKCAALSIINRFIG